MHAEPPQPKPCTATLSGLPPEVRVQIFSHLTLQAKSSMGKVNRDWRRMFVESTELGPDMVQAHWEVSAVSCCLAASAWRPALQH